MYIWQERNQYNVLIRQAHSLINFATHSLMQSDLNFFSSNFHSLNIEEGTVGIQEGRRRGEWKGAGVIIHYLLCSQFRHNNGQGANGGDR